MPYCHFGFQVHPLDSAVYHTEYVMRHKGAPHLQQEYGADLRWFQFYLLDVMAFCAAVALAAIFVAYKLLRGCCFRSCRSRKKEKVQ